MRAVVWMLVTAYYIEILEIDLGIKIVGVLAYIFLAMDIWEISQRGKR